MSPDGTRRRRVSPSPVTVGAVLEPAGLTRVAVVVATPALIAAAIVACGVGPQARQWFGFTFAGVTPQLATAGRIFANNARLACGVGLAALVWQLVRSRSDRLEASTQPSVVRRVPIACDVVLMLVLTVNSVVVGAAIGAYGWRMVMATLPHGPVEVAGYCVALNLYRCAREHPVPGRTWAWASGLTLSLLAVAALLETFATS